MIIKIYGKAIYSSVHTIEVNDKDKYCFTLTVKTKEKTTSLMLRSVEFCIEEGIMDLGHLVYIPIGQLESIKLDIAYYTEKTDDIHHLIKDLTDYTYVKVIVE